jgi:hypothetical protein
MLKKTVKTLEEVPEQYRALYEKKGDVFVLSVEIEGDGGGDDKENKKKLAEFRENNIKLQRQLEEQTKLLEQFKDIDPNSIKDGQAALNAMKEGEEKELIKQGKLDEVINRRLETYRKQVEKDRKDTETRIKALEGENGELKGKYGHLLIDTKVNEVIGGIGTVRKGAMSDILNRARSTWKANEKGELTAEGLYNEEGKPMSLEEWGRSLLQDASYLFEPSQGGGAKGGDKKAGKDVNAPRSISGNDPVEFGKNLKDIASGKVTVNGVG